ncbi:hypothetical protein TEA_003651 [Camellia sinensis var. sinensis]|uniref:Uncharacterized protein n=1 Tax=Camellia sinensis var. sinensis TaxID=542762 RepID=A0A4S4E302_CAMSN|nr:hypothetical protein TEA_003651 [Camellia sinensis var. sinensis]
MTTAARPTWAPAKGGNEQGGTRIFGPSQKYSSRDIASHTTLKPRKEGQDTHDELQKRNLREELEDRERRHFSSKDKSYIDDRDRRKGGHLLLEGSRRDAEDRLIPRNVDADDADVEVKNDDERYAHSRSMGLILRALKLTTGQTSSGRTVTRGEWDSNLKPPGGANSQTPGEGVGGRAFGQPPSLTLQDGWWPSIVDQGVFPWKSITSFTWGEFNKGHMNILKCSLSDDFCWVEMGFFSFLLGKNVRRFIKRKDSDAGEAGRALEEIRGALYSEIRTSEGAKRQQQRLCGPVVAMTFNFMVAVGIIMANKLVRNPSFSSYLW